MTDMEYTLSEIEREARALARMFDAPEPGLASWLLLVGERLERIAALRVVQAAPVSGGR